VVRITILKMSATTTLFRTPTQSTPGTDTFDSEDEFDDEFEEDEDEIEDEDDNIVFQLSNMRQWTRNNGEWKV
jgi:hypothetical protein